jgi:hypothetical protein
VGQLSHLRAQSRQLVLQLAHQNICIITKTIQYHIPINVWIPSQWIDEKRGGDDSKETQKAACY